MLGSRKSILAVMVLLLAGAAMGIVISANLGWPPEGAATRTKEIVLGSDSEIPEDILKAENTSKAFVAISKEVIPTVVIISTIETVKRGSWRNPFEGTPFHRFFDDDLWGRRFRIPEEYQRRGLGSGIIVSKDGYILTNRHVTKGAEEIKVTLTDKREFDAEVVGADSLTEVAVVKIDAKDLPTVRLGDSDRLEIGEWVMAFGNPLGLSSTVTSGIVSALGRSTGKTLIPYGFGIENFIQTDAVINKGNSGGPLVNLRGEVVGINTAIQTPTEYYIGYGFAIPINLARKVMEDLIREGRVVRAFLGIAMGEIDEAMAEALGLDRPKGVLIQGLLEDGPAKDAGVKEEDVLVEVNGQEVNQPNQVQIIIARLNPGDKVKLLIIRDGKEKEIEVVLGERGESGPALAEKETEAEMENLGLSVQPLTEDVAERLGYEGDEGVLVTGVERYSPAAEAGIRRGDLILEIGRGKAKKRIRSVEDFKKAVSELEKGKAVLFRLKRGDNIFFTAVEVPR